MPLPTRMIIGAERQLCPTMDGGGVKMRPNATGAIRALEGQRFPAYRRPWKRAALWLTPAMVGRCCRGALIFRRFNSLNLRLRLRRRRNAPFLPG